jgi:hypothetical protein
MNDNKPIQQKVADAVTRAADIAKQAVEDFADAAAKAPDPMLLPSNDPLSGLPMPPQYVPAVPNKRALQKRSKVATKKKAKTAAKKQAKKKKNKSTKNKRL